jgi:Trp operon repressor
MELLLTNMEIRALKETLETEISHLRRGIAAAKMLRTREDMVMRKELLLSILEKLPSAVLDVA